MKKLLGILVLGLLWCNTEERIFYEFRLEFNLENTPSSCFINYSQRNW